MVLLPFIRTCVRLHHNVKVQELRLNCAVNHSAYETDIGSLRDF